MLRKALLMVPFVLAIAGCNLNKDTPVDPGSGGSEEVMQGLIQNADFEVTEDNRLPKFWSLNVTGTPQFDFFKLDTNEKESGEKSLKVTYIDSLSNPDPQLGSWGGIYQTIPINDFTPGTKYYLKFWVKSEVGKIHVRLAKNGNMDDAILSYMVPTDPTWMEYKIAFTTDPTTSYLWLVINTKPALASGGYVIAWIDNLRFTTQ